MLKLEKKFYEYLLKIAENLAKVTAHDFAETVEEEFKKQVTGMANLDEKEVEKIKAKIWNLFARENKKIVNDVMLDEMLSKLCKLQPKNQVVIAEGKIKLLKGNELYSTYLVIEEGRELSLNIFDISKKQALSLENKKVKIILEVQDENI